MNPYNKYLGKEDHLQRQVIDYLNYQYNVKPIPCNTEGNKSNFERFKFNYMGGYKGILDLFIPIAKGGFNGLFIELKADGVKIYKKDGSSFAGKKGEHIEFQQQEINRHLSNGYLAGFCVGFEECKIVIDNYFSLK